MSTYAHPVSIRWGADAAAPNAVRAIDSAGAAQVVALTTPIAETPAGSGVYTAVATFDTAWGLAKDYWTNGDGTYYPGDGPPAVNVMQINGEDAVPDTGGGGVGTGSGDTPIDHDGGPTGTTVDGVAATADIMRFEAGGVGVDNVEVVAYLKSDYDAGSRGASSRRGTTYTGSDGRWKEPLMLDSGTYTILASKGGYLVDSMTVVVP